MSDHPINSDINLLDGNFYANDVHRHFKWMRENAPVYFDPSTSVWGVTKHADVMHCSKNPELFCNRFGQRPDSPPIPSMINMDDPGHKRRRNLVNRGFTPRRVMDHEPVIRRVCADLIETAREKQQFDFVSDVAAPLPMVVIGDLLGVAPEDRDDLLRWSDDLIRGTSTTASPEVAAAAAAAFQEYAKYHERVVADRRAKPLGDDLMSILVHAEIDGDRLGDDELLQESLLILVGGDETTRHVITGGMYQLLVNPDQRQKLIDDPTKISGAVEEMLRYATPIQNMNRTLTRDIELGGQKLREGDKLLLLYPSANRDEEVFADPFAFDVERSPNDHVAFGGYGTHFCLGASLARLELKVMFEELIKRAPDLELMSDEPPRLRPSNFIVGIEELAVQLA